jgi:hypothetical protein
MPILNISCIIIGAKKGHETGANLGKHFGTKGAIVEGALGGIIGGLLATTSSPIKNNI